MKERCQVRWRTRHTARTTRERYVAQLPLQHPQWDRPVSVFPRWEFNGLEGYNGHNQHRTYGLGLPATRTTASTLHSQSQEKGDEADWFHRTIGSVPRGRHRDPPVDTAVRHVTNTQPHLQSSGRYGVTRPLDEVHVRCGLYWGSTRPDRLSLCLTAIEPLSFPRLHHLARHTQLMVRATQL